MKQVKGRTVLFTLALCLLAWWLLRPKHTTVSSAGKPQGIDGLPSVHYVVPELSTTPGGVIPHGALYDWMNGEQCGCGGESRDTVIDTVILGDRLKQGFVYVAPLPPIPSALKSAPTNAPVPHSPTVVPVYMPPPLVVEPFVEPDKRKTFWFGWRNGVQRVIYLSDRPEYLVTGKKAPWKIWSNGSLFDPGNIAYGIGEINAIYYDGTVYQRAAGG